MSAKLATLDQKSKKREADVAALLSAGGGQLPAVASRVGEIALSIKVEDQSSKAIRVDVSNT